MHMIFIFLLLYLLFYVLKFEATKKVLLSWLLISFFMMFYGETSISYLSIFHVFSFSFGFLITIFGKFLFLIIFIYFLIWK